MKKQTKILIWALIGIIAIIILLGILYYSQILQSFATPEITAYSQISHSKNSITYSALYQNAIGFSSIHTIAEDFGKYFINANTDSQVNHGMWRFYLEMNGINSDLFKEPNDPDYISCVFSPISNAIDLSNIGFTFSQEFSNCYSGNFNENILQKMVKNMECYIQGNTFDICFNSPVIASLSSGGIKSDRCVADNSPYNLAGTVSYSSGNGFVCNIDSNKFFNLIPKTFDLNGISRNVKFAGISGKVVFQKKLCQDVFSECSDGSKIKTKECINGNLVDTNNKCQPINIWGLILIIAISLIILGGLIFIIIKLIRRVK